LIYGSIDMSAARCVIVAAAACATLVGCRGGGGGGGPKVTLRYHPPTGAIYRYTLEQQNSVKMEGGPMAQLPGQDITLHIYYSQAVTGPTAGGIGVTVTYDSTTMAPGGMAAALDRMRGLTSKVVYDDRMHVVSASFSGIQGQASPLAEQMGKSIKGMTLALPDAPVGVGDSWTSETDLPIGAALGASAPLKSHTKLTVKQIQAAETDTSVVLAVETTFPGEPFTITQGGRKASVRLTGTVTGEQVFSLAKSVPVHFTMGGSMRIAMRDLSSSQGMTIAMEQQTTLQLMGAN